METLFRHDKDGGDVTWIFGIDSASVGPRTAKAWVINYSNYASVAWFFSGIAMVRLGGGGTWVMRKDAHPIRAYKVLERSGSVSICEVCRDDLLGRLR